MKIVAVIETENESIVAQLKDKLEELGLHITCMQSIATHIMACHDATADCEVGLGLGASMEVPMPAPVEIPAEITMDVPLPVSADEPVIPSVSDQPVNTSSEQPALELPPEPVSEPAISIPAPYPYKKCTVLNLSTNTPLDSSIDEAAPYSTLCVNRCAVVGTMLVFNCGGFDYHFPIGAPTNDVVNPEHPLGDHTIRALINFEDSTQIAALVDVIQCDGPESLVIGKDLLQAVGLDKEAG